jgi:hypothetical protein
MARDIQEHKKDRRQAVALRNLVAIFWAMLVGSQMAFGAYLLDVPAWQIPSVAALAGAGAAIYVLYFA